MNVAKRLGLKVPFLTLLSGIITITSSHAAEEWFNGGSLHASTVNEWNRASYSNKLATAADWAIVSQKVKAKVRSSGSMDTLKPYAAQLVSCVSESGTVEGTGSMKAHELAAACMVLMKW